MEFLQHYWWILISLLGGLLVFLLFVQGGQTLLYTIAKTEAEVGDVEQHFDSSPWTHPRDIVHFSQFEGVTREE